MNITLEKEYCEKWGHQMLDDMAKHIVDKLFKGIPIYVNYEPGNATCYKMLIVPLHCVLDGNDITGIGGRAMGWVNVSVSGRKSCEFRLGQESRSGRFGTDIGYVTESCREVLDKFWNTICKKWNESYSEIL